MGRPHSQSSHENWPTRRSEHAQWPDPTRPDREGERGFASHAARRATRRGFRRGDGVGFRDG
jgi:hypothetical protein